MYLCGKHKTDKSTEKKNGVDRTNCPFWQKKALYFGTFCVIIIPSSGDEAEDNGFQKVHLFTKVTALIDGIWSFRQEMT